MEKTRILIVEDEKEMARFLELELNHEGFETAKAHDGREGLDLAETGNFRLVLLDIMLPELSGLEVLRRLRRSQPHLPVIMLTARDQVSDKVSGLDLGADDYITKPFAIEELLARIRAALRKSGAAAEEEAVLSANGVSLDKRRREVLLGGKPVDLSKREFDLLEYLLSNRNIVLTREQILSSVWDYNFEGEGNAVDVYVRFLRAKLGDSLITTVRGVGYVIRSAT